MLVVVLLGIVLTATAVFGIQAYFRDISYQKMRTSMADYAGLIGRTAAGDLQLIHSVSGLYQASREVERREFETFVRSSLVHHPAMRAVAWAPRVVSPGPAEDRYPVRFLEPIDGREGLLRVDLAALPGLGETLAEARDSGRLTSAGGRSLTGWDISWGDSVAILPIFENGKPHDTPEHRRRNLQGFGVGLFDVGEIVETSLRRRPVPAGLDIYVFVGDAPASGRLVYFHPSRARGGEVAPAAIEEVLGGRHFIARQVIAGRVWSLVFRPLANGMGAPGPFAAWLVAAVGLMLTAVLAQYLYASRVRTGVIERQAGERTADLADAATALRREASERRQVEEELRQSETRLAEAQRLAHMGNWQRDLATDDTTWSEEAYRIFGIPPEMGVDQQAFRNSLHPEDKSRVLATVEGTLETAGSHWLEYRIIRPDGKTRHVQSFAEAICDPTGVPVRLFGTVQDVTELKRLEEERHLSDRRYRALFENMPIGFARHEIVHDTQGKPVDYTIVDVNPAYERILGIPRETAVGARASALYGTGDAPFLDVYSEVAETAVSRHFEVTVEDIGRSFSISVLSSGRGHFSTYFEDITEKKRAEEEVRTLAKFPEQNPGPTLRLTADGTLVYANPASTPILLFWDIGMGDTLPADWQAVFSEVLEAGTPRETEIEWDGSTFSLLLTPVAEDGYVNVYGRDVSEHKAAEEKLRQAKEAAELADRAKGDILANMSHEMRTPLNAIIGFSEVMRSGVFGALGDPRYLGYVEDIHRSGGQLLDLIGTVLDIAGADTGPLELPEAPVDLAAAIDASRTMIGDRARDAGIDLECEVEDGLPGLLADRVRILQILTNLLSNAVKFTPEGGRVALRAYTTGDGGVALRVVDTGIGIAPEHLRRVTDAFYQVEGAHARSRGGAGLGLTLVKKLVDLHEGSLEVASAPGVGTTVTARFPARRLAEHRER